MKNDKPLSRRAFLRGSIGTAAGLGATSLLLHPSTSSAAQARPRRRPNVLFIITDDQHLDTFGFLAGQALTPNIDRLAAEGVYFSRGYVSSSVCTPSRFACLTGAYASRCHSDSFKNSTSPEGQTNVQWNTDLASEPTNLAKVLQQARYATGVVGKWHNGGPPGWQKLRDGVTLDSDPAEPKIAKILEGAQDRLHEWVRGLGFDYAASANLGNFGAHPCRALRHHNQEWITKGALDFIEQNKDRPFYLYLATTLLHGPSPLASLRADPRITHAGLLEKPIEVQPSRQSVLERAKAAGVPERLAPATWLDDGIGAVLKKLEDLGLAEDTIVFYFNDHGVEGGKGSCYQGGVRTPTFIRWKGVIEPGTSDALVQNIDFAPTILDACGIGPPEQMHLDGVSLMPLLSREKTEVHDSVYFEIGHTRAVSTKGWKYLAFRIPPSKQMTDEEKLKVSQRYAARKMAREDKRFAIMPEAPLSHLGFPGGQGTERGNAIRKYGKHYYDADQLYHLENDPDEQKNLANDPAHKRKLEEMKGLLESHLADVPGTFGEFKTK